MTNPPSSVTCSHPKQPRARWILHMQASMWRFLMGLGMLFHKLAPPRPPKPNFTRQIPSTISGKPGLITLYFYVPKDYETQKHLWSNRAGRYQDQQLGGVAEEDEDDDGREGAKSPPINRRVSMALSNVGQGFRRRSQSGRRWGGYPVIINFHGGGFTLGTATDDARWCGTVVDECHAVVVSVDYRLAPECPFPTAVEDGADAVLWVHEHAEALGIDREKIAISGFSSGGNMAFTVPLRLYDEMTGFLREEAKPQSSKERAKSVALDAHALLTSSDDTSASSSSTKIPPHGAEVETLDPNDPAPQLPGQQQQPTKINTQFTTREIPDIKIRCIVPWYPSLDYTRTRDQRRATTKRKDQELPALFTDLFDESYLHPPDTIPLASPYLSPGVAPTDLLRNALPEEIIMHTCEWDMLLDEGEAFRDRLMRAELGPKRVWYKMVEGVPHGWDKAPNPWKPTPGVREHYLRACKELRRVFGPQPGLLKEHPTNAGPSAAPRGSVSVVR